MILSDTANTSSGSHSDYYLYSNFFCIINFQNIVLWLNHFLRGLMVLKTPHNMSSRYVSLHIKFLKVIYLSPRNFVPPDSISPTTSEISCIKQSKNEFGTQQNYLDKIPVSLGDETSFGALKLCTVHTLHQIHLKRKKFQKYSNESSPYASWTLITFSTETFLEYQFSYCISVSLPKNK